MDYRLVANDFYVGRLKRKLSKKDFVDDDITSVKFSKSQKAQRDKKKKVNFHIYLSATSKNN